MGHSLLLAGNYGYEYQHADWDPFRPRSGYAWAYNAKLALGWRALVRFFKQVGGMGIIVGVDISCEGLVAW